MATKITKLIDEITGDVILPVITSNCIEGTINASEKLESSSITPDKLFPNSLSDSNIQYKSLTRNSIANDTLTFGENDHHLYYYRIILLKANTRLVATLVSRDGTNSSGSITFDQFKAILDNQLQQSCSLTGIEGITDGFISYTDISIDGSVYACKGTSYDKTDDTTSIVSFQMVSNPFSSITIQSRIQIR